MLVGNNNATIKASSVNYTQLPQMWTKSVEAGTSTDSSQPVRNWLDGIYSGNTVSIKYPTFQPKTYSMLYISNNDMYSLAKVITESGNIYGLTSNTDSHLLKNSEWGAVAYLAQSQYGLNGKNIMINNISLNSGNRTRTNVAGKSGVDSIYAVTGCTTGENNAEEKITTIENINATVGNTATDGVYTWDQLNGTMASSSGTIYGIYDLSGGMFEKTAAYVPNGNIALSNNGSNLAYNQGTLKTVSTKYTTVYPYDNNTDNTSITPVDDAALTLASKNNRKANQYIYGDGIREAYTNGYDSSVWYDDTLGFMSLIVPFSSRGGAWDRTAKCGLFSNGGDYSDGSFWSGFRVVLIVE